MLASFRPWLAVAVLAAGVCAPAFAAGQGRTVIPFEISELHHMVVTLEINDTVRTTGVVDTAATFALVDSRAVEGGVAAPGPEARRVSILGVNGSRTYPVVRLDSVDAGGFRFSQVDAAYSADSSVPGSAANILPASAFPGDVLEFDFESGRLTTYNGNPEAAASRVADRLDYQVEGGLIFVEIRVNGKKGRALIDTGANLSYVNSAFAKTAKLGRNEELTRVLLGVTGGAEPVWVARVRNIRLAGFEFNLPDMIVSDPAFLEELELAQEPVLVLGLDVLSKFHLQFDRRRQRLTVSLPAGTVEGVGIDLQARATRLPG